MSEAVLTQQVADNFHDVHVPRVFDVAALTYLLESKGIAPLVWGEMAALAYHSRTVPPRLFFIVLDNLFGLAIDTLRKADLERMATYGLGDRGAMALHRPYVRFRLRQFKPRRQRRGEAIEPYLQLFSASQVGLSSDSRAWEDGRTFSVGREYPSAAVLRHFGLRPRPHSKFLVTSQPDFFAVSLHLIHTVLTGGFDDDDMEGSLLCLTMMIADAFVTGDGSVLGFADINVPEKYAELAFILFEGLPANLRGIGERDPRGSRLRSKQEGVGTNKRVDLKARATEFA